MEQEGYLPVPTFDYSSAFNYRSVLSEDFASHTDEDHFEGTASRKTTTDSVQQIGYYLLTSLAFLLFLVTIPVSFFFCVKVSSSTNVTILKANIFICRKSTLSSAV